jgi:hypothetical protein
MATLQRQALQIRVQGHDISQEPFAILTKPAVLDNQFPEITAYLIQKFQNIYHTLTLTDDK